MFFSHEKAILKMVENKLEVAEKEFASNVEQCLK